MIGWYQGVNQNRGIGCTCWLCDVDGVTALLLALMADMRLKETCADEMDLLMDDVITSLRELVYSPDIVRLKLGNTD